MAFIYLIFIFSLFHPYSTETTKVVSNFQPSVFKNTKIHAENNITELNSFSEHEVNITEDGNAVTKRKLLERHMQTPHLNDSHNTVQFLGQHAGYINLPHSNGARMFYYFFESRNNKNNDPVVLWLAGGPGCSGALALFYENGPFHIAENLSLKRNEFGWDKISNLIYVDQPIGTGFSYSSSPQDIRHSTELASVDFYDFLQGFFRKYPQYRKNDLYIAGDSYAGHYIPSFSSRIQKGNRNSERINLKGMAIGNGLTNPEMQYKAVADYALNMKLINVTSYKRLSKSFPGCQELIKRCAQNKKEKSGKDSCVMAFELCGTIFKGILQVAGGINYYDIRKKCVGPMCYDFSKLDRLLNQKAVTTALGVGDRRFTIISPVVSKAMVGDWMKNYATGIPALLENGVKLLVYAGEYDLSSNWIGNSRWVTALEWSGKRKFKSTSLKPFTVDGKKAGMQQSYGPLTFLKVHNAGHFVPMDQPNASLEMMRRWMKGQPL